MARDSRSERLGLGGYFSADFVRGLYAKRAFYFKRFGWFSRKLGVISCADWADGDENGYNIEPENVDTPNPVSSRFGERETALAVRAVRV